MNQTINKQESKLKKLFQLTAPIIAFLLNAILVPQILILIGIRGFAIMWIKALFDVLIIIGTTIYFKKLGIELFKKVKFKWWYLLLPIILFILNIFVKTTILNLIFGPQSTANGDMITNLLDVNLLYTFVATVLIAPVLEEIIFRGVIMGTLFENNIWLGLFSSSVVFALIHNITDLYSFINYFVIGLLFGMVYKLTNKSLAWSIGAHMFNNLIGILLMVIGMLAMR